PAPVSRIRRHENPPIPQESTRTHFRTGSPAVVTVNGVLVQPQENRGVVVEDVALLPRRQERSFLHTGNRQSNGVRPYHLVRSEHDALAESRVDQPLQIGM